MGFLLHNLPMTNSVIITESFFSKNFIVLSKLFSKRSGHISPF